MIPVSTFNMLIAVDLILIVYSVIDLRNKMYANIIAAFLASILAGYLAVVINAGIVQQSDGVAIQDASLAIVPFGLIAAIMMIYTALMVYEAREEKTAEAEAI